MQAKQRLLATRVLANDPPQDLALKAKDLWIKLMPHSSAYTRPAGSVAPHLSWLKCYVAKSKSEVSNGYLENDPLHLSFKFDSEKQIVKAECLLYTKPEPGSYHVYDRVGLRAATFKGDEAKILKSIEAYMKKAKELIKKTVDDGIATDQTYSWNSKI